MKNSYLGLLTLHPICDKISKIQKGCVPGEKSVAYEISSSFHCGACFVFGIGVLIFAVVFAAAFFMPETGAFFQMHITMCFLSILNKMVGSQDKISCYFGIDTDLK